MPVSENMALFRRKHQRHINLRFACETVLQLRQAPRQKKSRKFILINGQRASERGAQGCMVSAMSGMKDGHATAVKRFVYLHCSFG